jgi:type VI secretion system secreted protein VgrG
VTGCVYNGKNKVPYPLPEHKTRSTFRTDTHQGTGFNEVRFEDQNGREEIYIHAQKDIYTAVEDSSARIVGSNDYNIVEMNQANVVKMTKEEQIGLTNSLHVGMLDIKTVSPISTGLALLANPLKKDSSWGEFDIISAMNFAKLGAFALKNGIEPFSSITHVQGSFVVSAHCDQRFTAARDWVIDVKGSEQIEVGKSSNIVVDESRVVSAGKNMEYYAGDAFIIACGESSIELTKSGEIRIVGKKIKFEADQIDEN